MKGETSGSGGPFQDISCPRALNGQNKKEQRGAPGPQERGWAVLGPWLGLKEQHWPWEEAADTSKLGADRSRVVSKSLEMPDIACQLWVSLDACQLLRLLRPRTEAGRRRRKREKTKARPGGSPLQPEEPLNLPRDVLSKIRSLCRENSP